MYFLSSELSSTINAIKESSTDFASSFPFPDSIWTTSSSRNSLILLLETKISSDVPFAISSSSENLFQSE
jgi:hypothetical protein